MKFDIKTGLFVFLCFLAIRAKAQKEFYILEGEVVNSQTKLFVNDAEIRFPSLKIEFKSDKNGFFRIAVPSGEIVPIIINHPDFEIRLDALSVKKDTIITFGLEPLIRSFLIGEVEKTAERYNRVPESQAGMEKLPSIGIKNLPVLAGEKDVLKSFTWFPGIQSATEGTTELNVRGGSSDQNLYLLDNSTIYKSSHLLGMLSTFQALTTDEVDFYKGGFPARFGGRLSSVVDVKTRQPNTQSFQLEGEIGLISAKILTEIPVLKGKSGLMFAARGTYIDKIARIFVDKNELESFSFYDIQVKYSHQFNKNNKFVFNYFTDRDDYYFYDRLKTVKDVYTLSEQTWENQVLSANYSLKLNEKLQTRFFAGFSRYNMYLNNKQEDPDSTLNYSNKFMSTISDYSLTNHTVWDISAKLKLDIGGGFTFHKIIPAQIRNQDFDTIFTAHNLDPESPTEFFLYSELLYKLNPNLNIKAGVRNSNYFTDEGKTFSFLEPRLLAHYLLNESSSIKLSYSRMSQFLHLLTNPGLGLPVDLWMASGKEVSPGFANQISADYSRNLNTGNMKMAFTAGVYFKKMQNITSYLDGYSSHNFTTPYFFNTHSGWQSIVTQGQGKARDVEVMAEKLSGDFTGWLSYTLSSITHQFKKINNGKPFPSGFEQKHSISLVGQYKINQKYDFSFSWDYHSGKPVTIPLYIYFPGNFNFGDATVNYKNKRNLSLYAQGERNGQRMEAFHRLNIAIRRKFETKHFYGNFELSVYNLYNRHNPFYYYLDSVYNPHLNTPGGIPPPARTVLKSVSIFPVIPSVSVSFKLK